MLNFLETLFETGELTVPRLVPEELQHGTQKQMPNFQRTLERLHSAEATWRLQLPGEPPSFLAEVAADAARVVLAICQGIVYRETEMTDITHIVQQAGFLAKYTMHGEPAYHYSVDMLFRFLPQLLERAQRLSLNDPLVEFILELMKPWPLSSVGIRQLRVNTTPPALRHPSLWRMYVDRIITQQDRSRTECELVREAVAAAGGPFEILPKPFMDNPK
ncbi:MAG: hypothetical protein R3C20_02000 [Planctomycetaceae bacterium]